MNSELEDDALRPEYDFSGGVRGKHYRAYRKGTAVVHSKKDRRMETKDEQLPLALKGRRSTGEVLNTIQSASRTEREKGAWFERLFCALALSDGALEVERIWSWRDWPEREELTGLDARDIGIDLVARTTNGHLIAIQCKCHEPSTYLRKGQIDSFLGGSQHECFDLRWIVSTCRWGPNAEAAIENANPPVRRIDFNDYLDTQIEDGSVERPVRQPNPAQRRAIDDVVTGLRNHPRGQLVMACGTGKTYTSLRIAEELTPPGARIVFAAPSIALVSQARKEWLRHALRPIRSLVVCSDTTAGSDNPDDIRLDEMSTPVTTDSAEIEHWLRSPIAEETVQVVFCTYQSLERVTQGGIAFDLGIADEAHRTTGRLDEENPTAFTRFHHELQANKRLYMTATPRIYAPAAKAKALDERGITVVDMDDVKTYGPELHRLSFKDGVEQGLLSDYRVIVLGVDEGSVSEALHKNLARVSASAKQNGEASPPTTEEIGRVLGLSLAMNGIIAGTDPEIPDELPRVIGYARSIGRSKWYCRAIEHPEVRRWTTRRMRKDGGDRGSRVVEPEHVDGKTSAINRSHALRKLNEAPKRGALRAVMNARLFSEGVDVPALDAVAFLDPRASQVDIVQSVGRVMRRAPGKRFGYIVVPVIIPPRTPVLDALAKDRQGFQHVGKVLRALYSHDGRLADEPWRFVKPIDPTGEGEGTGGIGDPPGGEGEEHPEEGEQIQFGLSTDPHNLYAQLGNLAGLGTPGKATADQIQHSVRSAGKLLAAEHCERELAQIKGLGYAPDLGEEVCTIGALMVFNAAMLHKRLEPLPHFAGMERIETAMGSSDIRESLRGSWKTILQTDYRPVFDVAVEVLNLLPDRPPVTEALQRLARAANAVASQIGKLRYDHAGPLYHEILPTSGSDGAMYTGNVGAAFLAALALHEETVDWLDLEAVKRLKVWDPSCGTGTLLMAVLNRIKDLAKPEDEEDLHKRLVEQGIAGTDINPHAIQLAASNLTLGAPTVDYRRMHLYTLPYGVGTDGRTRTGALDILESQTPDLASWADEDPTFGAQVGGSDQRFVPRDVDIVIMNPPFTNLQDTGAKAGPAGKRAMDARKAAIRDKLAVEDELAARVVHNAKSVRPMFTVLAERGLRGDRGTLAKVLPVAGAVVTSGLEERKLLASRFHVTLIVASHHHREFAFSGNTDIHECLVVARRREGPTPPTRFVILDRMPRTPEEAARWAAGIQCGDVDGLGRSTEWPAERVREGDWTPVQWYDGTCAEYAWRLKADSTLTAFKEIFSMSAVRGAHHHYREARGDESAQGEPGFKSISAKLHHTLGGEGDARVRLKDGKPSRTGFNYRGHLMLASKMNTQSGKITAVYSLERAIAVGLWASVHGGTAEQQKALCAYWNSTVARLQLLNVRPKTLTYPSWSTSDLEAVRIPKGLGVADSEATRVLCEAYEAMKDIPLKPNREMGSCPVRERLDEAAAEACGFTNEEVAQWREAIAAEPTIKGRKGATGAR